MVVRTRATYACERLAPNDVFKYTSSAPSEQVATTVDACSIESIRAYKLNLYETYARCKCQLCQAVSLRTYAVARAYI